MRPIFGLIPVLLFGVVACTTTDEIIIDEKGVDMSRYEEDLTECQSYGEQVQTDKKAGKGAASGALVGALMGAITGGGEGAARGAGIGAVGFKPMRTLLKCNNQ